MITTEFVNREYNAREYLPEAPLVFARWAERAAEIRRRHPCVLDLAYGDTAAERLDLFPASDDGAPLLVFVHGGYWRSRDKADFSWIAPPFVAHGASVALVNYGLAPHVAVADIVRQVLKSLAWLWRNGDELGFDPQRIVVAGHSAGGHLTAMSLAARFDWLAPDLPRDLVKGGVIISGLFELEPLVHASFLNVDLRLDDRLARALSPSLLPRATDAPVVTAVGGVESSEFQRQNRLIAQRWGSDVTDVPMPGLDHLTVCDALATDTPLRAATLQLLRRRHPASAGG